MDNTEIRYTSAPEAYDGFGTSTVEWLATTDNNRKTYRIVAIPESAFLWQTARYSKCFPGDHATWSNSGVRSGRRAKGLPIWART